MSDSPEAALIALMKPYLEGLPISNDGATIRWSMELGDVDLFTLGQVFADLDSELWRALESPAYREATVSWVIDKRRQKIQFLVMYASPKAVSTL